MEPLYIAVIVLTMIAPWFLIVIDNYLAARHKPSTNND